MNTARWLALGLMSAPLLAGCEPVRQDRTIHWSGGGQSVGFQHGKEGLFVAGKEGGPAIKVFQPGADVAAISTPLWNPHDGRLIFTTARLKQPSGDPAGRPNPATPVVQAQPITYTCWLRPAQDKESPVQPVALFEADCNHLGYVAANLAVRWDPHGDRILYIRQDSDNTHGLYEYDLATRQSRRAFPHFAEGIIFDWTPDGSQLVCILGDKQVKYAKDGIWIGHPGTDDWWHVPESSDFAWAPLDSLLERLQATRPAWTSDGKHFAFAAWKPKTDKQHAEQHFLRVGSIARHTVQTVAKGTKPFRDLAWAPDGQALGCVRGEAIGTLELIRPDGKPGKMLTARAVRHFAGWSHSGVYLAYVVPDTAAACPGDRWAFLLLRDPSARDTVWLAPAGSGPDRQVFSGMQVTFPAWSPKTDELSLWVTFRPARRFLLGLFPGALRSGDPAAILDTHTGRMHWLAVDGREKAQVGHYYLLRKEYAAAWDRYTQAERELPAPQPPTVDEFLGQTGRPVNIAFFQYYCLHKLGRAAEADRKLELFRSTYLPREAAPQQNSAFEWWLRPHTLGRTLLRDAYAAEVFLSVDALEDGERFFRGGLDQAKTDTDRLSQALLLGQFYLLRGNKSAYAELSAKTIFPLLLRESRSAAPPASRNHPWDEPIAALGVLSLCPLASPEFVGQLPHKNVAALIPRWSALRAQAHDNVGRLGVDLCLHAAYRCLGNEDKCKQVARRIQANPVRSELLPEGALTDPARPLRKSLADVAKMLDALREQGW